MPRSDRRSFAIFDKPRFFHLGLDEETAQHQRYFQYAVVRQYELYWHDFHFYCDQVESAGVRPWIWSDKIWHDPEDFLEQVPTSTLQSNWYYGNLFEDETQDRRNRVLAYPRLNERGYEQIPTASNHSYPENFALTVEYCRRIIDGPRLLGFLQTPWRPTTEPFRDLHMAAIEQVAEAMAH